MPVVVLTPRHAGPAQRIGDRTWRKLVLPVGSVQHGGKALHFTASYVSELAEAFTRRPFDYVPIQLAGGLDPEDFGGHITDVEAGPDGLWATISTTERGDRVLSANPRLPLSARICENYGRSDGQFFAVALQSVASGQAIGLSNAGPQAYVDLSNGSWAGAQIPDDQLTDAELTDFLDAVAEADQEAMMDESDIDLDQVIRQSLPLNGYRRELGLANDNLARFSRVFEMANAREQERIRQDERCARTASTSEERLAAALDRAANRTLVPQGAYAVGLANQADPMAATTGGLPCGFIDATGRCGERFHAASCNSLADPFLAEALRPQMAQIAARPWAGTDGQVWYDRQTGAAMSLLDHAESSVGVRLGDKSLFETGKSKREVVAPQRRVKFGDPDSPADEEAWSPVTAATRRTAQHSRMRPGACCAPRRTSPGSDKRTAPSTTA